MSIPSGTFIAIYMRSPDEPTYCHEQLFDTFAMSLRADASCLSPRSPSVWIEAAVLHPLLGAEVTGVLGDDRTQAPDAGDSGVMAGARETGKDRASNN